jgi:hypothetical protein
VKISYDDRAGVIVAVIALAIVVVAWLSLMWLVTHIYCVLKGTCN